MLAAACGGPSPTKLSVTVTATSQANPNSENQPSPTVVRLYDLKSVDTFNSASFTDLYYDDAKKLGGDLLGRREIEIQPDKTMKIDSTAAPDTLFLGVLAGFRDLDGTSWRSTTAVSPGDTNQFIVTLQARSLTLGKPPSRFLGIF